MAALHACLVLYLVLTLQVLYGSTQSTAPPNLAGNSSIPAPMETLMPPPMELVYISLSVEVLTPTFVVLSWEIDLTLDAAIRDNVKTVQIQVSEIRRRVDGRMYTEFNVILPVHLDNFTLGPLQAGVDITFSIEVHESHNGDITSSLGCDRKRISLPTCDLVCKYPLGGYRDISCSICICGIVFSGPNCEDPEFYPRKVSVWPTSVTTLHIQWEYDEVKYTSLLMDVGLVLTEFRIEISSGSVILVRIDSIPTQRRSYSVRQLRPGVEYTIRVGAVAVGNEVVIARAPPVQVLIEGGSFTCSALPSITLSPSPTQLNPTRSQPTNKEDLGIGITLGAAIGTALLVGIISVVLTALCMRKMYSIPTRERFIALNPVGSPNQPSNQSESIGNSLQPNPAYGQLSVNATTCTTTPHGNEADHEYYNTAHVTANTGDTTSSSGGTLTYDYVNPNL